MTLKPIYKVNEFLAAFGLGRTKFYELVNIGAIRVHKAGKSTVIKGDDAQAFLDSLPVVEPKQAA